MAGRAILVSAILVLLGLVIFMASPSEANRNNRERNTAERSLNNVGRGRHRKGKLFSLFNVVTFNNEPCASTSTMNGINRNGTCYTSTECDDKGGSSEGNCAAGFGVCCIFTIDGTNGRTTVDYNCTYIQNEGYPSAITGASTNMFTINKCNDDVCYLRLDFAMFSLLGTNGSGNLNEGVCTDTFVVNTPTGENIPTICGQNMGQHMYVDIGANSGDSATLAITTTAAAANRMWDIKVTQIECNNLNAPRDASCLQYHTTLTGRLTSFNYDSPMDNHLNNQQYSICIRPAAGFCCVEYRVCQDQANVAVAGSAIHMAGFSFDTSRNDARNDGGCRSTINSFDYIGITGSGATCANANGDADRAVNNRYCGAFLNQVKTVGANIPICDCTAPFQVDVHFNNNADGSTIDANGNIVAKTANTIQSRGFCLDYRQIPC